jgi:hypothetical protein
MAVHWSPGVLATALRQFPWNLKLEPLLFVGWIIWVVTTSPVVGRTLPLSATQVLVLVLVPKSTWYYCEPANNSTTRGVVSVPVRY